MVGCRRLARTAAVAPSGVTELVRTLLGDPAQRLAFALIQFDAAQGTSADTRDAALWHPVTVCGSGKAELS